MTEWWEKASPGGPPVGPPFIRPLYPPDAKSRGKTPSTDGGDIEAIKRAISRSGHWPWQEFDQAFSNSFSHGRSPNVSDNGLAGFQRQNGIDATGWMGEATYQTIRYARVPDDPSFTHRGEPILDARAVDLLENYAKHTAGGDTLRLQALAKAEAQVGYKESPAGTNGNMFGSWYGMNYEPWCAMFVTWCYETAGGSPSFQQGSRYAYCPYVVADARAGKYGLKVTTSPTPGDLCVYDWQRDGTFDHIGLFHSGTGFSWQAIEGNTSTSNNSNGGEVMRRNRSADDANVVFVRVAEP